MRPKYWLNISEENLASELTPAISVKCIPGFKDRIKKVKYPINNFLYSIAHWNDNIWGILS